MEKLYDLTFADIVSMFHAPPNLTLRFGLQQQRLDSEAEDGAVSYRDFFGLCMILRGSGTHRIDSVHYSMARGDVYVVVPGTVHAWTAARGVDVMMGHFTMEALGRGELAALNAEPGFRALFLKDAISGRRGGRWLHLTPQEQQTALEIGRDAQEEAAAHRPTSMLMAKCHFFRLLAYLSALSDDDGRAERAAPLSGGRDQRLAAALTYLDENFTEHVRLEDAAALAYLSPDRFTRLFVTQIGCTPRDYLRHLRLERARALLAATDKPIAWISHESGFSEPPYFARVFREATGMTPREYRRSARGSTMPKDSER